MWNLMCRTITTFSQMIPAKHSFSMKTSSFSLSNLSYLVTPCGCDQRGLQTFLGEGDFRFKINTVRLIKTRQARVCADSNVAGREFSVAECWTPQDAVI